MSYEDIKHWNTPEEFNTYLLTLKPPKWFKIIINHHTYEPTVDDWRGLSTMKGMLNYYKNKKKWDRFPHLFVAPDGIWQMNKLNETGIHANAANSISIGVEVVGNYDKQVWQEPIRTFAFKTNAYLAKWGNISLQNILPHRQYNPLKSCPGRAIDMNWVRQGTATYLHTDLTMRRFKARNSLPDGTIIGYVNIRQAPNQYALKAGKIYPGDIIETIAIKDDERKETIYGKTQWLHITHGVNARNEDVSNSGFAHISLFEEIT